MEDAIQQLQSAVHRIKEEYIYYKLSQNLVLSGVDQEVAHICSIEFSEVVDEYFRSLKYFIGVYDEDPNQTFVEKFVGHLQYTNDTGIAKIEDIAKHLISILDNSEIS